MSSFADFEILLFKTNVKDIMPVHKMVESKTNNLGYLMRIVSGRGLPGEPILKQILMTLSTIEVTEEMSENKNKKVMIIQLARGFLPDDMNKVKKIIYDALIEYEFEVVLLDKQVKLEKADTFFNRVAKYLKISQQVKEEKKRKHSEDVDAGDDN